MLVFLATRETGKAVICRRPPTTVQGADDWIDASCETGFDTWWSPRLLDERLTDPRQIPEEERYVNPYHGYHAHMILFLAFLCVLPFCNLPSDSVSDMLGLMKGLKFAKAAEMFLHVCRMDVNFIRSVAFSKLVALACTGCGIGSMCLYLGTNWLVFGIVKIFPIDSMPFGFSSEADALFPTVVLCAVKSWGEHPGNAERMFTQCSVPVNKDHSFIFVAVWFIQLFAVVQQVFSLVAFAFTVHCNMEKNRKILGDAAGQTVQKKESGQVLIRGHPVTKVVQCQYEYVLDRIGGNGCFMIGIVREHCSSYSAYNLMLFVISLVEPKREDHYPVPIYIDQDIPVLKSRGGKHGRHKDFLVNIDPDSEDE